MARTSATLVTTAAAPAPNGSAASERRRRSPRRRRRGSRRRAATSAASSPSSASGEALEQRAGRAWPCRPGAARTAAARCSEVGHRTAMRPSAACQRVERRQRRAVDRSPTRCATRARRSVDVDWRPPAGGDADVVALLSALWGAHGERVEAANAAARRARSRARAPHAVTVAPAGEVVAGLDDGMLLHSGPPIDVGARLRPAAPRAASPPCLFEGWAADRDEAAAAAGRAARSRCAAATSTATSGR